MSDFGCEIQKKKYYANGCNLEAPIFLFGTYFPNINSLQN